LRHAADECLGLLVEHDHARFFLHRPQAEFGLDQVFLGVLELLLEEHAPQLRFRHRQSSQHLGDLAGMRVGQFGGELGLFVIDLDRDQAALLVRRDADVRRQHLAQGLVGLDSVARLQVESIDQRTLHAIALEQGDVELVGRLCAQTSGQAAQRPQRRQCGSRAALLLGARRQQSRARRENRRQQQRDDDRTDRRNRPNRADQALALPDPGQQLQQADARALVVEIGRCQRRQVVLIAAVHCKPVTGAAS